MVQIEILSGPESGQIFDLGVGTHTLGRAASNSRVLGVESVSGRHLELTVNAAGEIRFRDLGSTNGTWSGGLQVADGEWFPGSELKLGKCVLRLVAEGVGGAGSAGVAGSSSSALDEEDSDIHRRAREAAMSGKRRGGPLQMALGVVLVLAAGGGAWWTFGRNAPEGQDAVSKGGVDHGAGVAVAVLDAIDSFGRFEDPESWTLSQGASIRDGSLYSQGGTQLLRLSRNFPLTDSALEISAQVSDLHAFAQISWGNGEEDNQSIGTWESADLSGGSTVLALPEEAAWFQIALRLEGQGSLENLVVDSASASPQQSTAPVGKIQHVAANMLLSDSSGVLLSARGQNGNWSSESGGLLFSPNGNAVLEFHASGSLLEAGSFLILADGGPVGLAPGVMVDSSPGILFGGGAMRLMITLEKASNIRFENGGALLTIDAPLHLRWDLAEAMTQAARLSQKITRSEREGNDQLLLASAAELLRDLPLDEQKVQEALIRSQESLERGRADLAVLQVQASGAVFVGAGSLMSDLAADARALAARYPGTAVEPQANSLADDLESGAARAAEGSHEAAQQYRERLQGALTTSYPLLAAWLQEVN